MLALTGTGFKTDYRETNSDLAGTYSGQKNNETFSVSGSTSASTSSAVGDYAIVPAVTGATLSNYLVIAVDGKLTVTKAKLASAQLSIPLKNGDRISDPACKYSGQKNNETFSVS